MPPRGDISPTSSTLLSPKETPPLSTNLPTSLLYEQDPSNTYSSTAIPSPKQPPSSPRAAISTRSAEPIPCTPASHILRYPRGSTLRVPATQGLPQPMAYREPYETLCMLGVVYTCVHKSVHACTVMYTRVYNRAFIPISFSPDH